LRLRFKIFLPTLITLSLIGFVVDSGNNKLNVKYYTESEWVKTTNPVEKDSNSFFYSFYLKGTIELVNLQTWSNDYAVHFNDQVRVKLLSQIKTFSKREPINLLLYKSYTPRKSVEDFSISC